MQNFRVLGEDAGTDRPIFEQEGASIGATNFADSIDMAEDEDIFEAVDRAGITSKGDEGVFTADGESVHSIKKKAKKKKEEKTKMNWEGLKQPVKSGVGFRVSPVMTTSISLRIKLSLNFARLLQGRW